MFGELRRFIQVRHPASLIVTSTVLVLIALRVTGFFFPGVNDFVSERHFFEIIVLVCLLEIMVVISGRKEEQGAEILQDELSVQNSIINIVDKEGVRNVDMLAAGLGSRASLVALLLERGCSVRLLAQHPDAAIDKVDGERVWHSLATISHIHSPEKLGNLTVRWSLNPASLRAVLLRGDRFGLSHAVLSWYTYAHVGDGVQLSGRGNPSILLSTATSDGRSLITFAQQVFESTWTSQADSRPCQPPWQLVGQDPPVSANQPSPADRH